jgi:nucleoside-diphosphate-sugar epimerase
MKALIIGSEGNIGKPLVKHLKLLQYEVMEVDIKQGWRPNYLVADVTNPIDLIPAFVDFEPDVVFMLSAMVSRVTCEQAPSLAVSTNLLGLQNVLEMCKRFNSKCIYFSTSEVYGPDCEVMDESLSDPKPNNRYGLSKLLGERLVEYEVHQHGLRAVTLRPFMMYDEFEEWGDHRSAMIRFATNLAEGKEIEVHLGSERAWLHVSDAVRAIEKAAHLEDYSIINVGQGDFRSIKELADLICLKLGADSTLINEIELPGRMTLTKRPTLDRMNQLLGGPPQVSFEDGVDRVCSVVCSKLG